jgi:hypothetical protein
MLEAESKKGRSHVSSINRNFARFLCYTVKDGSIGYILLINRIAALYVRELSY